MEVGNCASPLLSAQFAGDNFTIDNLTGSIQAGNKIKKLGKGTLTGILSVGKDSTGIDCIYMQGDPFGLDTPFNQSCANTPLLRFTDGVLDNRTTILKLNGDDYNRASLPNIGSYNLTLQNGTTIYRIAIDMSVTGASVEVGREVATNLNNLKGGDRFVVDTVKASVSK